MKRSKSTNNVKRSSKKNKCPICPNTIVIREVKKPQKKYKRISKNTAYKRGRQFEYRVKKHFEKLGYYVKRSYASKGAEDLIAIKALEAYAASKVLLIQCKNLKVEKKLDKKEINNLKALAKQTGGTPLHVFNRNHKLVIEEIA